METQFETECLDQMGNEELESGSFHTAVSSITKLQLHYRNIGRTSLWL